MTRKRVFSKMRNFSGKTMEFCMPARKCEPVSVIARACGKSRVYSMKPNLYFRFQPNGEVGRCW